MPKPSLLTGIHAHEFSCANQKHAQQPLYLQSWPRKVRLRAKKTRFLPYAPSSARTAPLTNAEGLALRPRRLTPLSPRSQAGVRARISAPQKGEEARTRVEKSEPNAIVAPPNLTRRSPQEDRQGARHDRVPQVSRQPQCMNQIVASPHTVVVKKKNEKFAHTGQLVLELGQGRVTGEAETRGRRKPPVWKSTSASGDFSRWRGGRRDDSARTRRKILMSTQAQTCIISTEEAARRYERRD